MSPTIQSKNLYQLVNVTAGIDRGHPAREVHTPLTVNC